jgi:hypothetical protein
MMFSFIQTERYASFDFRLHQWTNYIHIRRKKVNQYSKINAILKSGCFLARETDICQVPWVVGRGEFKQLRSLLKENKGSTRFFS